MSVFSKWPVFGLPSDEELMRRVQGEEDHGAFARLVQRWEEPIRRLCVRMTGEVERGEDLKQETFMRLFERRKEYRPISKFSTFLWRVALNRCYDELRRQGRRREFLAEGEQTEAGEAAAEGPGPDLEAAVREEGQLVRQAVLGLPEIYRAVILLRHYEDLKLAAIAEILEIPEGTVNSRLAEALTRLSRALEPQLKAGPWKKPSPTPPFTCYESSKT
jgi:RNA polymerase sigma factor (sigma-70 family)